MKSLKKVRAYLKNVSGSQFLGMFLGFGIVTNNTISYSKSCSQIQQILAIQLKLDFDKISVILGLRQMPILTVTYEGRG